MHARCLLAGLLVGLLGAAQSIAPVCAQTLRFATYNASLNRATEGALRRDLAEPGNAQADTIAEVIQRVRPDVLLINEFDHDAAGESAALFQRNYLSRAHGDAAPIEYRYSYSGPVNTGLPSGFDLDRDGRISGGNDALGFGAFPGQYGMLVLSRYPIDLAAARTFQHLLWRDMPGAAWPDDPATPQPGDWYSPAMKAVLPLSSKSHWDLPLQVGGQIVHLLVSHPTPPVFDGPEDRNGRRNHDEIRFWADYLAPRKAGYIQDDAGRRGGLDSGNLKRGARAAAAIHFVIMGDENADPVDGGSYDGAILQLLRHPRVQGGLAPRSNGALEASHRQGGANERQHGDPAEDTADFDDADSGNLRVDYVLPSRTLQLCANGVFWPPKDSPMWRLVNDDTRASSDHRLVWADVLLPPQAAAVAPAAAAATAATQCSRNSIPTGQ